MALYLGRKSVPFFSFLWFVTIFCQMKLSVALCTYNGAKFIESQIDSILNQSLLVDEIVVSDDGSTDNTLALLNKCQERTKVNIRILTNQTPLGVNGNFSKAIHNCSGEIIFLADQDDIWKNNKVEKIVGWFESHPRKEAVFTNATFIDIYSKEMGNGQDLFKTVGFTDKARFYYNLGFALEIFLKNDRATGATMAIKRSLIPHIDLLKDTGGYHDEKISAEALQRDSLGYITERLMYYRIHAAQNCGLKDWLSFSPDSDSIFSPLLTNPRFGSHLYRKSAIRRYYLTMNRDLLLSNTGKYMSPWNIQPIAYVKAYPFMGGVFLVRDFLAWIKRKFFEKDTVSDTSYRMGLF